MKKWICKDCKTINAIENKNCIKCNLLISESASFKNKKNLIDKSSDYNKYEEKISSSHKIEKNTPSQETNSRKISYKELSIKDWVITLLIAGIPLVGFIMLFVWGFSDNPHPVRSKWAKATLIVFLIGLGLWFLIMILFALSMISSRGY